MRRYLISALSISALLACAQQPPSSLETSSSSSSSASSGGSGGGATTGAGGSTSTPAHAYFEEAVSAIFEGTCADCHSDPGDDYGAPDFLGLKPSDYYENLVARVDFVSCDTGNSVLLRKGLDEGHAGPALTEGQHDKVLAWLTLEAAERFGGVCQPVDPTTSVTSSSTGGEPPPVLTGELAMQQFGECMTLQDWIDGGMPEVANQTATHNGNQVPCMSCHANGTGDNWMPDPNGAAGTEDVAEAFEHMRWMYASFNLVRWTVNNDDGSFKDLVPAYRWRDKGQEGSSHPPYTLKATYLADYEAWFDKAKAKWLSGDCAGGGAGSGGAGGGQ